MNNKTLLLAFILTFSSCGIFISVTDTESTVNEVQAGTNLDAVTKFVGKYDITVFGVPDIGALELTMTVTRDGDLLKTEIEAGEQESGLDIDAYVDSYGINITFEIYVDGNTVTGYLADMFELEGTITY
jgi:hypothetical protein